MSNKFKICLLILTTILPSQVASAASAEEFLPIPHLYDEASDRVFKVGTASSIRADLRGHGTGFAVTKDGLFATAYHVISDAITGDRAGLFPQVYLVRKGARIQAQIWAIDTKNDLAIVKVPVLFPQPWSIQSAVLPRGSNLVLIGFPGPADFSILPGLLQSTQVSALLPTYQVTAPVIGGMSGGPVLSQRGEVVGVTLARLTGGGDITFTSQGQSLENLVNKALSTKRPLSKEEQLKEAQSGFLNLQEAQTALLNSLAKEKASFHGWKIPGASRIDGDVICSEREMKVLKQSDRLLQTRQCHLKMIGDRAEVFFELKYYSIPVEKNRFKAADLSHKIVNKLRHGARSGRQFGEFSCDPDFHFSQNSRPFALSVCTRVSNSSAGLYHSILRLASLDFSRQAIVAQIELMGFTQENSLEVIRNFIDAMEVSNESI